MTASAPLSVDVLVEHVVRQSPDGDPLSRLSLAVGVAAGTAAVADELIDYFVAAARQSGSSWNDIGGTLGVSRQAAQQRFGGSGTRTSDCKALSRRLTPHARRALRLANAVAGQGGLQAATTQHLLMGVLHDRRVLAVKILDMLGVDAAALTRELGSPCDDPGARSASGASDGAVVLERAVAEAAALGHDYVGTEHLLLALLVVPGRASDVLAGVGADYKSVRNKALGFWVGPSVRRGQIRASPRA